MSHRRYVEQTSKECTGTGTEPKVWVNQYMARAAGTQEGRTVGSFLLAMQDQVPSWQGQIPKMLARMRGKYVDYQERNPSASCPQLGVVEAAIAWVDMIAPVLARPPPPPPPAFGEFSDEEEPVAKRPPAKRPQPTPHTSSISNRHQDTSCPSSSSPNKSRPSSSSSSSPPPTCSLPPLAHRLRCCPPPLPLPPAEFGWGSQSSQSSSYMGQIKSPRFISNSAG